MRPIPTQACDHRTPDTAIEQGHILVGVGRDPVTAQGVKEGRYSEKREIQGGAVGRQRAAAGGSGRQRAAAGGSGSGRREIQRNPDALVDGVFIVAELALSTAIAELGVVETAIRAEPRRRPLLLRKTCHDTVIIKGGVAPSCPANSSHRSVPLKGRPVHSIQIVPLTDNLAVGLAWSYESTATAFGKRQSKEPRVPKIGSKNLTDLCTARPRRYATYYQRI